VSRRADLSERITMRGILGIVALVVAVAGVVLQFMTYRREKR
jgi:threonine/homoserine efflux transporter RhtA